MKTIYNNRVRKIIFKEKQMSNNELISQISDTNLENFKKLVRRAIFLEQEEEQYFNAIPNDEWRNIFATNFNGNFNYARRVILNHFDEVDRIDSVRVDKEKLKIFNLEKATNKFIEHINEHTPILIITDFDNDGSLAQAVTNEYLKIDASASQNIHMEYAQTVNGNANRGLTVDLVEKIVNHKNLDPNGKFLIVTADNGINSREEQLKIHKAFPNADIIITDHHNPDPEMVIEENEKAIIFNPQYKPTEFYQKFNISGAATIGVLLKNILTKRYTPEQLEVFKPQLENIQKLFKVSNLLDYVNTDPVDKPERDYIITKFLKLQPLLNINNSISKIITGEIPLKTVEAIQEKIPNLDTKLIYDEARNIHIQNNIAEILLQIYEDYKLLTDKEISELTATDFSENFLEQLNISENFIKQETINPNFIEQLRPLIFGLSADDTKTSYLNELNEAMINVFENVKTSEQKMAQELRRGEKDIITRTRLPNSVIYYADENILTIFNRKFLNKVYNDENPGFSLTLDNLQPSKVSGSFRSLYDISDILKDKHKLENIYNIKIETPGHEKAAGFIVKSLNPKKYPINQEMIDGINSFINNSIAEIKLNNIKAEKTFLLTDLQAITLIDRINVVIRGNISNFERITPLLKITPDTVWTDAYTTKQYSMEDICNEKRYGYITIGINFHGDTVIIPVELVRRIVENDYKDYISLNYMDGGVFMADRVLREEDAGKIIDLRNKNNQTLEIYQAFEKHFSDKNYVEMTRKQIKDNPFFKYNDYGELDFDLFEKMVIGVIDTNKVEMLTVFDVEANGFGNAKLMNFGAMNYHINPNSGDSLSTTDFEKRFFSTPRGEDYLLTEKEISELKVITEEQKSKLPLRVRKLLLTKHNDGDKIYYLHPSANKALKDNKIKSLPFTMVKNHAHHENVNMTVINREIEGTMLAYLISDDDFKVPQEMTNLTGITQDLLRKFGIKTSVVDKELTNFYDGKSVLFGAHNTPYDARVIRANMPEFYKTLKNNLIYDSALFSRQQKLAYDSIEVAKINNIDGLEKIHFYNNPYSGFNLLNFLLSQEDGVYPDRTGVYLLERDDGKYRLVNKEKHEIISLQFNEKVIDAAKDFHLFLADNEERNNANLLNISKQFIHEKLKSAIEYPLETKALLMNIQNGEMPNTSIKYSVEKLSEHWMIQALQLSDEEFDIKHVDLSQPKYANLQKNKESLVFFQDNYHFDSSPEDNLSVFMAHHSNAYNLLKSDKTTYEFVNEFLELNKDIQQKFSDSWMYKKVLTIKDPNRKEVTNDLIDLVNYQTNIPKEHIERIFEQAIEYKEKYNIEHILQHESHINGPWEGDSKGDVVFEDKLTFSLLAKRKYDSYNHSVSNAVGMFNEYVLEARKAFDKSDELSIYLANDSYSFRQGLLYNRDSKTEMIKDIQTKENNLENSKDSDIVKFKMGNSVLPPNTGVYAVTKQGVSITRDDIEEDSKKLAFIIVNEQLKFSIDNSKTMTPTIKENVLNILTSNDLIAIEYKQDLAKRYKYVEFNRKDYQLTKFLELIEDSIKSCSIEKIEKVKEKSIDQIDAVGFDIIYNIVINYIDGINRYTGIDITKLLLIAKQIEKFKCDANTSNLEKALKNPSISFDNDNLFSVCSDNFLSKVEILRKIPTKNLLQDHQDMRLLNQFIYDAQQHYTYSQPDKPKCKM